MSNKVKKLKNGIKLITHTLPNTHSITISVNFRVGSIYESNKNNGITHLVEHLFFRKLYDLSQDKLYFKMQSIGSEIIGKTFKDYVSFSMTVVPKFFNEAITLMDKLFYEFCWSNKEIDLEKRVVIRQIENKYESFSEWINNCYLKDTKYSLPVMGNIKNINSLTPKEINLWKEKFFYPNNSCVVLTGNTTSAQINLTETILEKFLNKGIIQPFVSSPPEKFNRRNKNNRFTFSHCDSEFSEIVVFFDVCKEINYETVRLLVSILGEGCGSKLAMAMREKFTVTDDVFIELTPYYGFSNISISFTIRNDLLHKGMKLLFQNLREVCNSIVSIEYESSIRFFTDNQLMDLDNPQSLNREYVLCDFVLDVPVLEPMERKKKYESLTLNDLILCAKSIFTSNNISFLIETSENTKYLSDFLEKCIDYL